MFTRPTKCPNQKCRFRDGSNGSERLYGSNRFWIKRGYYRTKHDPRAVPRYSCRACGKCFNSRTRTPTAGQHKPLPQANFRDRAWREAQDARVQRSSGRLRRWQLRPVVPHQPHLCQNACGHRAIAAQDMVHLEVGVAVARSPEPVHRVAERVPHLRITALLAYLCADISDTGWIFEIGE